MNDLKLTN